MRNLEIALFESVCSFPALLLLSSTTRLQPLPKERSFIGISAQYGYATLLSFEPFILLTCTRIAPKKAQKMSLNEFLGDSSAYSAHRPTSNLLTCPTAALGSWADEMDSLPTARKHICPTFNRPPPDYMITQLPGVPTILVLDVEETISFHLAVRFLLPPPISPSLNIYFPIQPIEVVLLAKISLFPRNLRIPPSSVTWSSTS